ncbi:hypothetical protein [Brevundimonas sp.]|uniref:hypothetical protein n=1 Tax=Brevundimonas sp. TaxID=1871086 RepID=UPI002BEDE671|nr:hypothetical protein [Brevundimonas sp.]HWQ86499.1 hypothetical protein [Brevundimonas sp.]
MILMAFVVLAITALTDPDPLAPARDGQVQCYTPDVERKTCRAIGSYLFEPDGRIINDAENMLNEEPFVILRARSAVYVRDGAVCATDAFDDRHIRTIEVNGNTLEGEAMSSARSAVAASMRETIGTGEYCSTYHPKPDGSLRALVTVNGLPRPDAEDMVLWIRREDGWRVAP